MKLILNVTFCVTLLVFAVSSNKVSRFSVARIEEAAKSISQLPALRSIAKGPFSVAAKAGPIAPAARAKVEQARAAIERRITPNLLQKVGVAQNAAKAKLERAFIEDSKTSKQAKIFTPFGPHLIVNSEAQEIARAGAIFQEASAVAAKGLGIKPAGLKGLRSFRGKVSCPFNKKIGCNSNYKYRTIDGSCNNLKNPIWGKANTPFERFLPPHYNDGFQTPRSHSVFGTPLPMARVLSTEIHKKSTVADLHPDITHLTMEFGQLISHDVNRNTLSAGYGGGSLTCCKADGSIDNNAFKKSLGCLPIELPKSDPFFAQFGRTCMNFVRASPTPDLNCDLGSREQLNQVTHYIDASTIYGSDTKTMNDIRLKNGGLLKVTPSANGDLILQNPSATGTPGCRTTGSQHCFKAGDVRANQQPGLMTLHTIFLREHNRVAKRLASVNPQWNDERLFQEARKIVGAEIQHITYNEYLPTVLGNTFSSRFGFAPQPAGQYYSGYDETFNPAIRNGFAAAGYRFGHSSVRDHVAAGSLFKDHFLNPALIYQNSKGPSFLVKDLYSTNQQKTDNLMTTQLTNHLFERSPGAGIDLAATNIQRGRDHGIANYNLWRIWCGLSSANTFQAVAGGLADHDPAVAALLESQYAHTDDIDLWTGIVTETPLEGRAVGPTGACVIGRQFWVLKHADRFYYENNDAAAKFEIEQLDEIRKTSLAKIICDNTDITSLPRDVLEELSAGSNPNVQCSNLPAVDLTKWDDCKPINGGWSSWGKKSKCLGGSQTRRRQCNNPKPNACGKPCIGASQELIKCGGGIDFPIRFPFKLPSKLPGPDIFRASRFPRK